MAAQTVQERSQLLVFEAMHICAAMKADSSTNSRFEMISKAQGILQKIDTFVREELKNLTSNPMERNQIQGELEKTALLLKEIVKRSGPDEFMKSLLSRTMEYGTANLAHDGIIAFPFAPFEHMERLPRIGFYGQYYRFPFDISFIRLHPVQVQNLPESLQTLLADRNLEKLDLISSFTIGHGYLADHAMSNANELRYNWVAHPWVFPQAQIGQDLNRFLEMGIYEPVGLSEVQSRDGIPFNTLKPLEVYVHPVNGSTAISPNNAHFRINPEMPISSFWHVMLKDERTIMVRQLINNIEGHPMSHLVSSVLAYEDLQTIQEHLDVLKTGRNDAIDSTLDRFDRIAKAFEGGRLNDALLHFNALSEGEKKWIHFRIWQLMGEPVGVHGDFGRVSFEGAAELPAYFHATVDKKAQALRELGAKQIAAFDQIINGHLALFATPHDLPIPSAEYLRKREVAQPLIEAVEDEALFESLIESLKAADRQKLCAITWELKGCPLGIHDDFGLVSLLARGVLEESHRCSTQDKLNVLHYFVNNAD
ncbi:MAG: hypothetical protein AB7H48_08115 [Parachlamydiales bacterium]